MSVVYIPMYAPVYVYTRLPRSMSLQVRNLGAPPALGGPWVVISGVLSRVTIMIANIRGLLTLLVTTHEPPSTRRDTIDPMMFCAATPRRLAAEDFGLRKV